MTRTSQGDEIVWKSTGTDKNLMTDSILNSDVTLVFVYVLYYKI